MVSNTNQLKEYILSIVSAHSGVPVENIMETSNLESDLMIDSVTRFEILGAIESAFSMDDVTEAEVQSVETVGNILELVSGKLLSI
jgi:acyl carrier protein